MIKRTPPDWVVSFLLLEIWLGVCYDSSDSE